MIKIRKSDERGFFDHGWLKTHHTFSFSEYYDPNFMGFGSLRVINEDYIGAGEGFPTHGHRDMEIITYVIEGAVAHRDSTGGHGVIRPGEVQKMTAGRGVQHSEFNGMKNQQTHLYQIWILPHERGLPPSYEQRDFGSVLKEGKPVLLASPNREAGSVQVHQDIKLWARWMKPGESWSLETKNRLGWLQVLKGDFQLGSLTLQEGDGAAIDDEDQVLLKAQSSDQRCEVLFFDMKK